MMGRRYVVLQMFSSTRMSARKALNFSPDITNMVYCLHWILTSFNQDFGFLLK